MPHKTAIQLLLLTVITGLYGCSEARKDPCRLLSVPDIQSWDDSVSVSIWAGRDGEKQEDEVCMFYTDDGDPRLMLFAWYDKEKDPRALVEKGMSDSESEIIDVPGIGSEASAAFVDDEFRLLAVKSTQGVVGIRVRKPVLKGSTEFDEVKRLAEKALANNK